MPYVNIKESTIVNGVAKQIGAVQDIATAKVYDLVNDSIQKVRRSSCPPLEETQRLQQRINSVTSSISNISIRINKFTHTSISTPWFWFTCRFFYGTNRPFT